MSLTGVKQIYFSDETSGNYEITDVLTVGVVILLNNQQTLIPWFQIKKIIL